MSLAKKILLAILFLLLDLFLSIYLFIIRPQTFQNNSNQNPAKTTLSPTPALFQTPKKTDPKSAIIKVGDETIYQKDYETELAYYPQKSDAQNTKKILYNKLIEDSVFLQSANRLLNQEKNLNSTVFNSPDKDYNKRISLIGDLNKQIKEQGESKLSGTVISIWFYNIEVGPLGYEKSKALAFEKISKLYEEIKSKKITIDQAGEIIKADTASLKQLDPQYKLNAIYNFEAKNNEPITFDRSFDSLLRKLKVGETTNIHAAKGIPNSKEKEKAEVAYFIGQLKKISNSNLNIESLESWLSNEKQKYEIKTY